MPKQNVALEKLQIEYVPANSVKPNTYNPNRQSEHDFELLVRSMDEDGFTQPIVGQRQTREIIDGEHRWTCAVVLHHLKKNKLPLSADNIEKARADRLAILDPALEIPVVFTDMTAEQMRIATLRHNRARGSEDYELAAMVIRDLEKLGALDWAQDSLMLDDIELQKILQDLPATEMAGDEFSEAWKPELAEAANSTTAVVTQSAAQGATVVSAMSLEAIEAKRAQEARIAAAKTDEEKKMIAAETKFYRIHLVFAGEEAEIVKGVLGDQPAVKLLELCKSTQHHQ